MGRIVGRKLGYSFVDTGEIYRALTWLALRRNIDLGDESALSQLAAEAEIETCCQDGEQGTSVLVDGFEVTTDIHRPPVEAGVSLVSKVAGVRKAMVAKQRRLAKKGRLIMAGRDIGSVVLPQAELKVFLLASLEERARRRYAEQAEGENLSYEEVLADLKRRDEIDSQRSLSPLRPARDATIIDTGGLTAEEVSDQIVNLAGGN